MWQGLQAVSLFAWSFRAGCLILQGRNKIEVKMRKDHVTRNKGLGPIAVSGAWG